MRLRTFTGMGLMLAMLVVSNVPAFGGVKLKASKKGIYHSVFPDLPLVHTSGDISQRTKAFEALTGKGVATVVISDEWINGISLPSTKIAEVHKLDKVPIVSIYPWSEAIKFNGKDAIFTLDRIMSGYFDSELKRYARAVAALKKPVVINFAPEANGNWYPWSGYYNGGGNTLTFGDSSVPDGPERYVKTYQHIIDVFNGQKVDNVTWVVQLISDNKPDEWWNVKSQYYLGDKYLDWIGVSVYSAQQPGDSWDDFADIMDDIYPDLAKLSKTKPIAILEFGIIEDANQAYRKSDWLGSAFQTLVNNRYPRVKLLSYWHESSWISSGKNNFRVDSSASSTKTYKEEIKDKVFLAKAELEVTKPPKNKGCYCGITRWQGIDYCAIWKEGDARVREYHRFSQCDIDVCEQLFSKDTVQGYCGGKITFWTP